jgi:hypothetical protein
VPDLTGQVVPTTYLPLFESVYSNIYIGECNGYKVNQAYTGLYLDLNQY